MTITYMCHCCGTTENLQVGQIHQCPVRVTDEMVERAALVIAHHDGYAGSDVVPNGHAGDLYRHQARKVLAAALSHKDGAS